MPSLPFPPQLYCYCSNFLHACCHGRSAMLQTCDYTKQLLRGYCKVNLNSFAAYYSWRLSHSQVKSTHCIPWVGCDVRDRVARSQPPDLKFRVRPRIRFHYCPCLAPTVLELAALVVRLDTSAKKLNLGVERPHLEYSLATPRNSLYHLVKCTVLVQQRALPLRSTDHAETSMSLYGIRRH